MMTSHVGNLAMTTVSSTSILQIGDSHIVDSQANVLAIQRQEEQFYGNEAPFSMYSIFSKLPAAAIFPSFHSLRNPSINKIHCVNIRGLSASSILHIGDSNRVRMVSRIKHIRQLEDFNNEKE